MASDNSEEKMATVLGSVSSSSKSVEKIVLVEQITSGSEECTAASLAQQMSALGVGRVLVDKHRGDILNPCILAAKSCHWELLEKLVHHARRNKLAPSSWYRYIEVVVKGIYDNVPMVREKK